MTIISKYYFIIVNIMIGNVHPFEDFTKIIIKPVPRLAFIVIDILNHILVFFMIVLFELILVK